MIKNFENFINESKEFQEEDLEFKYSWLNKNWWEENPEPETSPEEEKTIEYEDFITDDIFRKFLKLRKCYNYYLENCYKFNCSTNKNIISNFERTDSKNYIMSAFDWIRTEQGSLFWKHIHDGWLRQLQFYRI